MLIHGMPAFEIVGLPDLAVKEARQRVKTAIRNLGFELPSRKIIVNLAPANIKKEGVIYDLPITIGVLTALGYIKSEELDKYIIAGELSLDGNIRPMIGALPITISAQKNGYKKIILPYSNKR